MKQTKENGSSIVIIICCVVVLAAAGFIAWRLYGPQSAAKTTINSTQSTQNKNQSDTTVVKSDNGQVQFTLPATWKVTLTAPLNSPRCAQSYGTPNNPACILSVDVAPATFGGESVWYASAYSTTLSPKDWASYPLGEHSSAFTDESTTPINGYDTYYVKVKNDVYTDLNYFIEHNGIIMYFHAREHAVGGSPTPTTTDLTQYSPDFVNIVRTIKFNN